MQLEHVKQPSVAAVHFASPGDAANLARQFAGSVVQTSFEKVENDKDLFGLLAQSLRFPGYFGLNWDALDECLADIQWLPAGGCVLICTEADRAWAQCPATLGKLISAWLDAARCRTETGTPFHLVFIV